MKTIPNTKSRFFKRQSIYQTQQLSEQIEDIRNATAKDIRKWYQKPQNWINIVTGILVPITLGYIAYRQTELISKQSQQIQGFDTLLRNTTSTNLLIAEQLKKIDTQLVISQTMLASNIKISENAQTGNINRFATALYSIGELLTEYRMVEAVSEDPEKYLLDHVKPILESQMNNPYLVQNKIVMQKWVHAYRSACSFMESTFSKDFSNDFGSDGNTRIKEFSSNVKTDFNSCLKTINIAFKAGGDCLKADKNFTN